MLIWDAKLQATFQGRKMSKTLGNVIDPLDTIKDYGTDALRFTLSLGTAGQVCDSFFFKKKCYVLVYIEPMYRGPSRNPCIGTIYPTLLEFGVIHLIIPSYMVSLVSWCGNPQSGGVMHPPKPRG